MTTRNTVKEYLNGEMGENMWEAGIMDFRRA